MSKSVDFSKKFIYLPTENSKMENFLELNKDLIYLYITNKIMESLESGEESIKLFGFMGTEYCVLIHKNTFPNILDKYFSYFMEKEMYECCADVNVVREKLNRYNNLVKQKVI